ncbi:hypothetical protein BT69DRAFT_1330346 [Atractiella rhizophila]|nr:hypothetical protein BT69DRAFT_1330346 [Atractiella rhizophila]
MDPQTPPRSPFNSSISLRRDSPASLPLWHTPPNASNVKVLVAPDGSPSPSGTPTTGRSLPLSSLHRSLLEEEPFSSPVKAGDVDPRRELLNIEAEAKRKRKRRHEERRVRGIRSDDRIDNVQAPSGIKERLTMRSMSADSEHHNEEYDEFAPPVPSKFTIAIADCCDDHYLVQDTKTGVYYEVADGYRALPMHIVHKRQQESDEQKRARCVQRKRVEFGIEGLLMH